VMPGWCRPLSSHTSSRGARCWELKLRTVLRLQQQQDEAVNVAGLMIVRQPLQTLQ
jgi:hypothetical protein